MTINESPTCEASKRLLSTFFSNTNANEISETLSALLNSYIQHSEADRLTIANAATLVSNIATLAFNLEIIENKRPAKVINAMVSLQTGNECLHN